MSTTLSLLDELVTRLDSANAEVDCFNVAESLCLARTLRLALSRPALEASIDVERKAFETWYVRNAFDYERNPIGSRECGLQWLAWEARAALSRATPKESPEP